MRSRSTRSRSGCKSSLSGLSAKYGIEANWISPTEANVKRTGVTGKITCTDSKVTVFLDLSFMLSPVKDKVESRVRRELESCLA